MNLNDYTITENRISSSGEELDYYIDLNPLLLNPQNQDWAHVYGKWGDLPNDIELIVGPELSGAMLALNMAHFYHRPAGVIRKGGVFIAGKEPTYSNVPKALIVDDVLTTGKALNATASHCIRNNILPVEYWVIVDRRENRSRHPLRINRTVFTV